MDRFLMLGRQHLYLTEEEALKYPVLRSFASEIESMKRSSGGYSEDFLRFLGATAIDSLDFSDYEGANLVHDLNRPVPEEWHGRYDLVFDGGSLEHVFQFPVALKSAMEMVELGGHFVAASPSNHFNGHGFYQLSAELFHRALSPVNGFSVKLMAFAEQGAGGRVYRVEDPAQVGRRILFGGRNPLLLLVVARREKISEIFSENPSQSDYAKVWTSSEEPKPTGKRKFRAIRRIMPSALMHRYDAWQVRRRRWREARIGVHPVDSFSEAFQEFPRPSC
ncbi:MAG: hypothetical protein KDN18_05885 [Verrucomicrobiae bacterium]|nr:hypothetical protein [Verrucomicrobiae bacterium]